MKQLVTFSIVLTFLVSPVLMATTLTMGTFEAIPPYVFVNDDNELTGIDIDLAKEIFKRLNIELKIVPYPMNRLKAKTVEGELDGIIGLYTFDKDYHAALMFSDMMYISKVSIFSRKENDTKINSINDLEDSPVGIIFGYTYGKDFDKNDKIIKESAVNDEMLIKKLHLKRTPFVIAEDKPFWFFSRKYGWQDELKETFTVKENAIRMALSKVKNAARNRELLQKINKVINDLHKEGFIEKVMKKYR